MEIREISLKNILIKSIKLVLAIFYITIVIGLIAGGISAGVMTLLPPDDFGWTVSKANYLGYISICSFTPFSTLILFGMAILGFILLVISIRRRRRKSKRQ